MSDIFINYKEENPIYAPGIGTYSTTGEKGDTGKNGNGVYYYPTRINQNQQAITTINQKISNNKLLYSTTYEDNPNHYQENDIIIDSFGEVFSIIKDENDMLVVGKCIGSISPNSPNFFTYNGTNITTQKEVDNTDVFENYVLNIYTSSTDENKIVYNQYFNISSEDELSSIELSKINTLTIEVCSKSDGICTKYKLK